MVRINQKYMNKDGKTIGYVSVEIVTKAGDKEYIYPVKFDEKTRKRFNYYARSLGYTIGVTDKVCSDSATDRPTTDEEFEECLIPDADLPF